MNRRPDIKELSLEELTGLVTGLGQPAYRGPQLFNWLFHRAARSFQEMTDLPADLRLALEETYLIGWLKRVETQTSGDGTRKLLFELADGRMIESVLIPERDHWTLCLSSQVGCQMGCAFCYTGAGGFERDLTAAEMIGQVQAAAFDIPDHTALSNIVFMGMGEPLANLEAVIKAVRVMTDPRGLGLSWRKVTVSTIGLPQAMRRLFQEVKVRLAISLNAPDEATRSRIMPINRIHPLESVLAACKELPLSPGERITFEYVLLAGVNDSPAQARTLVRRLARLPAKVNLIPFNEHPASLFRRPAPEAIAAFQESLIKGRITTLLRRSMGVDILAACGQLRGGVAGS